MKIMANNFFSNFENVIKNNPFAYVVNGENTGVLSEISDKLLDYYKSKKYSVIRMDSEAIVLNGSTLISEINNISMFEDKKIILIRGVNDKIYPVINSVLQGIAKNESQVEDTILVLIGETLNARSRLRLLCEKNNKTYVIPCYYEDKGSLYRIAKSFFNKHEVQIDNDALLRIVEYQSVGDRSILMSNLEILLLYTADSKVLSLQEVETLLSNSGDSDMSNFVDRVFTSPKDALNVYDKIFAVKKDWIVLVRMMIFRILKLRSIKLKTSKTGGGLSVNEAIEKENVFFKDQPYYRSCLHTFNTRDIDGILRMLFNLEMNIKRFSSSENMCDSLFQMFILNILNRNFKPNQEIKTLA